MSEIKVPGHGPMLDRMRDTLVEALRVVEDYPIKAYVGLLREEIEWILERIEESVRYYDRD